MGSILGMDIGNKYAFMSVVETDTKNASQSAAPLVLVDEQRAHIGICTDAEVDPDGLIRVDAGLSVGGRRSPPKKRMTVRSVKNMLDQETIQCENNSRQAFSVKTADVYSAIVREMVTHANQELQRNHMEPVYDILLAIPAKFCDGENAASVMEAVRRSVESITIDGHPLHLVRTIPEPAAVALDYLYYNQFEASEREVSSSHYTVVVYDLGHGTFDTALVELDTEQDPPYRLHHQSGRKWGGKDMDQMILDFFANQAMVALNDPSVIDRLRNSDAFLRTIQTVKEVLSESDRFETEETIQGQSVSFTITREQFEQLIAYDVDETIQQLEVMFRHAEELGKTVDRVVLSGGCSQIPFIQARVAEFCAERHVLCNRPYRPSRAVSFGAARYAANFSLAFSSGFEYSVLLDINGGTLQTVIPRRPALPFTTERIQFVNQHDGFWIVRSLDPDDPVDRISLENFKRLFHFEPELPIGGQFSARITLREDFTMSVEIDR